MTPEPMDDKVDDDPLRSQRREPGLRPGPAEHRGAAQWLLAAAGVAALAAAAWWNARRARHAGAAGRTPEQAGRSTMKVQGPLRLAQPWAHMVFADPELEALSAGQKMMVRVGSVNERRLKARLTKLRAALLARPATPR